MTITSQISPWLVKILYPLAHRLIIPYYFSSVKTTGGENVPQEGPIIIAPTHRSRWDAIIVPYTTGRMVSGRDPHFMVSANEIKGIQGWFIRRCGGFPVETEKISPDSFSHSIDLLSQGHVLVIFPEGNIFRTQEVQPLKRGVAKIALDVTNLDVKIVPVGVSYSQSYPQKGCSVEVNIGKPIAASNYRHLSPRKASQDLTDDLEKALQQLCLSKSEQLTANS